METKTSAKEEYRQLAWLQQTVRTLLLTMKETRLQSVVMTPEPPETVTCGALWLYEKAKLNLLLGGIKNEGTDPICSIPLQ
jgi:hypothetical protein